MGLFNRLFGKHRATAPRRPRPRAVSGLEEGSPFVVVNTGKVDIVMPRAQFDAMYGEYSPVASSKPEDEAAVPDLIHLVKTSNNKDERKAAIEDMARMGPEGKGAGFLLGLLTDTDGQIPWRVFDALTAWENWIPPVVHTLSIALKHETPKVRSRALAMLMRLGSKALSALPAVKAALADENPQVRSHAEEASRSMENWRAKTTDA